MAIECLGNIFCTPSRNGKPNTILPSYKTRFMLVIEKAIEDEDPRALAAVLTSSKFVLGCNFKGTKVLIKSLNNAITTILEQDIDEDAQVRKRRGGKNTHNNNKYRSLF